MNSCVSFHGGASFKEIGENFQHLERADSIINADVLDAWFDPSPHVLEKLHKFLPYLTRTSPPIYASGLVSAIAAARGLPEACILTGAGSSDLIFTLFPHLVSPGQTAMILDPMYGEYQHVLSLVLGVRLLRFPLHKEECFRIDPDSLIADVRTHSPDLIVLVNPNSPTGQHWPRPDIIHFLDSIPDCTRVVIDETYIDYAGSAESVERDICTRPNVFALKSMSKVYGLSGLRVGYMVGTPPDIRGLTKWIPPWAVSLPAQVAGVAALSDPDYYECRYAETRSLREELTRELRNNMHLTVYPSITNLVLVETVTSAQKILETMQAEGVFVRNCDSMGTCFDDRFLRIAVKRRNENARIAASLRRGTELNRRG